MKRVRKPVLRSLFMLSFSAMPALPGWQQAMAATYPAAILADNPVAYYRLEETSGTTAFDSSGHLFDATYTPNSSSVYPTLGLPGITTNSVGFHGGTSGNADHVLIPFHPELSPALPDGQHGAPFSAECWVMSTTHPADYAVPLSMFGSYADPPPFNNASGWNFYQTGPPSGGTSFWVLNMKNGAFLSAATVPIALLQWYHLAVTFDGSTVTFYVNGVSRGTTSGITGYFANPSHNGQIGAGANTGFLPFTGNVDEVAFYTNALSLAQVQSHYQTGTNSFRAPPTPPAFVQQPVSTTNFAGTTASFSAVVSGTAPLYYQWKRGGVRISGATNSVYSLLATYPADDGATFSLTVTNSVGTNNSDVVTLTVLTNLDVLYPPFSITRNVGSKAAFRTVATGAIPLGYQWYKISGVVTSVIPGATNDILWLNSVQLADDQSQYFARITNAFTSVDSDAATLTVQARPVTVPITGYAKVIAADSPVALLRLDEGTGSLKAVDAFGSFDGNLLDTAGGSGVFNFQVPTGIPHETNTALEISGGAVVSIPYALEVNPPGDWSAETWLSPSSLGANGGDYRVVLSSQWNLFPNPYHGWYVYQQPSHNFAFVPQPGNQFITASPNDPAHGNQLVVGNWYHLVVTKDAAAFRVYINGEQRTSFPVPNSGFIQNGVNGDPVVQAGSTVIGRRTDNAFNPFDGKIDETAFYNYALSAQQVQNHFASSTKLTVTRSGTKLILTWPVGTLQAAPAVAGTYTNVTGATSPYTNAITGAAAYFRVKVLP